MIFGGRTSSFIEWIEVNYLSDVNMAAFLVIAAILMLTGFIYGKMRRGFNLSWLEAISCFCLVGLILLCAFSVACFSLILWLNPGQIGRLYWIMAIFIYTSLIILAGFLNPLTRVDIACLVCSFRIEMDSIWTGWSGNPLWIILGFIVAILVSIVLFAVSVFAGVFAAFGWYRFIERKRSMALY